MRICLFLSLLLINNSSDWFFMVYFVYLYIKIDHGQMVFALGRQGTMGQRHCCFWPKYRNDGVHPPQTFAAHLLMWIWRWCVSASCNSRSSFSRRKTSPPPWVCSFYCVLHDCWTYPLVHNMAHQACFHQPLGQEWWRRAGLCLGALHPLSSCSLPFISFFIPPCTRSNIPPFSLQSSMSPQPLLNAP